MGAPGSESSPTQCLAPRYYSGRYVGELSLLLPEKRVARFSVLDFWG